MAKDIKIPFKGKEQVTYYQDREVEKGNVKLFDNYEFQSDLLYLGFTRGRSALNIQWKDLQTGYIYNSGMSILDLGLKGLISNNTTASGEFILNGKFTFKKQGTSYLLTYIK